MRDVSRLRFRLGQDTGADRLLDCRWPSRRRLTGVYARHSALLLIERMDPIGFIIVIDDAEGPAKAFSDLNCAELKKSNIEHSYGENVASKKQAIISGGALNDAAYF